MSLKIEITPGQIGPNTRGKQEQNIQVFCQVLTVAENGKSQL